MCKMAIQSGFPELVFFILSPYVTPIQCTDMVGARTPPRCPGARTPLRCPGARTPPRCPGALAVEDMCSAGPQDVGVQTHHDS